MVDGEKVVLPLPPVQEGIRKGARGASSAGKKGTCRGSVRVLVGEVVVARRVTSVERKAICRGIVLAGEEVVGRATSVGRRATCPESVLQEGEGTTSAGTAAR